MHWEQTQGPVDMFQGRDTHSISAGSRGGELNACTMIYGSKPMDKSVFYAHRTCPAPIKRSNRDGRVG